MNNMKTLLERLEPEIRQELDRLDELYPNTLGDVYSDLENNHYFGELRYDTIVFIVNYCNLKDYSPKTIQEQFSEALTHES